ncbi:MAG: hypothetical protein LAN61_02245 [Acidobacteriia bacterium]|nr:hypothetical protein [Terriglobia bacterium]
MSIRETQPNAAARPNFDLRISLFLLFLLAGCGAPGEPQPPAPPIPAAISDLAAQQSGDGVTLTFTPPREAVDGERLAEPPALEIFRGTADAKPFRLVYTIPGALVETYVVQERVQFFDPLTPEDLRAQPGAAFAYRVRARASKKKASADSNTVTVRLFPVPERIARLDARVTEAAIELSWPAPERTSGGQPLPSVSGYRVYRGELDPSAGEAAAQDLAQAKWKSPLALLAPAPGNTFRDAQFVFGATYVYVVRSVVLADGNSLESPDSVPAVVTPKDTFPPAAPQGLVAIFIPGGAALGPQVDLSWSLNLETDLAGYRVYRSDTAEGRGRLMTPSLLPAPAFRDMSVEAGHRYWYTVTAVDRAGNESLSDSPVSVDVPQSSP